MDRKLYYKVLKRGQGPKLSLNQSYAKVHYLLTYLGGRNADKIIAAGASEGLNMSELIPGLAHGMLGMQAEEIREIYIHPDFAYGFQSNFDPGVAIKARIELLFLPPHMNGAWVKFPKLLPVDNGIADFPKHIDENQMEALRLKAAHAEGYGAWWFYGLGCDDLYTLNDVLTSLKYKQRDSGKLKETTADFVPSELLRVLFKRLDTHP